MCSSEKFDLTQLRQETGKGMPRRVQYCTDIINLFEKVNNLMKFVVIASDGEVRKVIKRKYSKTHTELLNMIMKQF